MKLLFFALLLMGCGGPEPVTDYVIKDPRVVQIPDGSYTLNTGSHNARCFDECMATGGLCKCLIPDDDAPTVTNRGVDIPGTARMGTPVYVKCDGGAP